jgi:subtilase family serine protease
VNAGASTSQTVAIVDAFDDPTVQADLDTFDAQYGLPAETASSLKVVNQTGGTSLPPADSGWAGEITLDVQAVRGLCHACRILLVEADSDSNADLATAVDYAAAHASIVSNSYGGPEIPADPNLADYDHPGVAILASTGDDGWYGWDHVNENSPSDSAPATPASYNTVVGVGGTTLSLNPDSSRAAESVWNDNGPADGYGFSLGEALGASGGGCSSQYAPRGFQAAVAGYTTLGCGSSHRNGVDVAVDADPFTGFDICQNYGNTNGASCGWSTAGGTSLSTPLVAALWALAGGPAAVRYPALSLYGHYKSDHTHLYDVTVGSNGLCDGTSPVYCTGGTNPNGSSVGFLDCAWSTTDTSNDAPLANRYQCYPRPGYDGVSGVGTPIGTSAFKPMRPTARIASPGRVTHGVAHTFSGAGSSSPFPGGAITKYVWNWGDGHTTTTSKPTAKHTYASKHRRTITLTVSDTYTSQNGNRTGVRSITVTVK